MEVMKHLLALLILFLAKKATSVMASGPTIDQDGWSPVPSSRIVQLPEGWPMNRHLDTSLNERIDVDRPPFRRPQPQPQPQPPNPPLIPSRPAPALVEAQEEEESAALGHEPAAFPQPEELEPQSQEVEVDHSHSLSHSLSHHQALPAEQTDSGDVPELNNNPDNSQDDQQPLIVYPSGTLPDYYGRQSGQEPPNVPEVPEVPRPPLLRRPPPLPLPPPPPPQPPQHQIPPNRRPPPPPPLPPSAPLASGPEPAYPRNAPTHDIPLAQSYQGGIRLPPRPRPHPSLRPEEDEGGLLSGIGTGINGLKCAAEEWAAESKLKDENFMRQQLECVLERGPCDDLGLKIKRLAPEVMRGLCPHPCDPCVKRKIQKVMSFISRNYPKQWNEIVREFGRRPPPPGPSQGDRQRRRDRRRRSNLSASYVTLN